MKVKYLYMALFFLAISACKKEEVKEPEFEVTTESKTYSVNEEVKFDFKGDPDLISFYSGELFHDYSFTAGRLVKGGALKMSFQSYVNWGAQANQFSVLASTDFNGNYTFDEGIRLATWTDITSKFALANSSTYKPSGVVDISDLRVENKPLYIAFKYNVKNQAATSAGGFGVGRTWRVQDLLITSETSLGTVVLGTLSTSGLRLVDLKPTLAPMRSELLSAYLALVAHNLAGKPELTAVETENWAITKAFEVGDTDFGPDRAIPIKGVENADVTSYTHKYTQPGTYKVHFIASNTDVYGSSRVVKELEITITP